MNFCIQMFLFEFFFQSTSLSDRIDTLLLSKFDLFLVFKYYVQPIRQNFSVFLYLLIL